MGTLEMLTLSLGQEGGKSNRLQKMKQMKEESVVHGVIELGQKPEEEEAGRSQGGICLKWILTNESAGHSSSVAVLACGRLRQEAGWMFKVRFGNRVIQGQSGPQGSPCGRQDRSNTIEMRYRENTRSVWMLILSSDFVVCSVCLCVCVRVTCLSISDKCSCKGQRTTWQGLFSFYLYMGSWDLT